MPDAPLPPLPPADQPRWRTLFDDLTRRLPVRRSAVAVGAAVLVLVAVGVVLGRPTPSAVPAGAPAVTPAPAEPEAPAPRPLGEGRAKEQVVVDVAGAVARPGLVRLPAGARVADALAAAGGPAADAEVAGVNQARLVADGEQVRVSRAGEVAPLVSPAAGGAGAPAGPIDLNRASVTELDTLPGVGPATAAAIVGWRDRNGRFRRVEDLLEVPGIGPARLERLRDLVRV